MQTRTFWKCAAAAGLLGASIGGPAAAQTPSAAGGGGPGSELALPLPPADSGKPIVFDAPARLTAPPPSSGCPVALACSPRLEGVVRRGGAVELKVTPFSW